MLNRQLHENQAQITQDIYLATRNYYENMIQEINNQHESAISEIHSYYQEKIAKYEEESSKFNARIDGYLKENSRLNDVLNQAESSTQRPLKSKLSARSSRSISSEQGNCLKGSNSIQMIQSKRDPAIHSVNAFQDLVAKIK